MGKTCFDCGKKIGWSETHSDWKKLAEFAKINGTENDEIFSRMTKNDTFCLDCAKQFDYRNAVKVYLANQKKLSPDDFELAKADPHFAEVVRLAEQQLNSQKQSSPTQTTSMTGGSMPSQSSESMPSGYEPPKTNSNSQNVSAAQLRGIAQAFHDQFKKDWDSTGVVQFKNNQIAILKRVWGQQVQFIVAYDHVTKEGYRLMAIDEGITAQGSGFSGGASAYFYFQKMEFVR